MGRLAISITSVPAAQRAVMEVAARERLTTWVIMAAVLAGGAFLRFWHIDAVGFNSDEAVYAGQAASIANDHELKEFFQIFRAHPLLFQSAISLGYLFGVNDVFPRMLSATIGVATTGAVFMLADLLYGRRTAIVAAVIMAFMPYHVIVGRQVLLDGPQTLFLVLAMYMIVRFALTERSAWLYAGGAAMGLAFLSKEPSILFLGAIFAFFVLSPEIPVRIRDLAIALGIMFLVIAPFPASLMLAGRSETGGQYFAWQLFRQPNHEFSFYLTTVPGVIGPLVLFAAILGLWVLRREWSWREVLLLCWIIVPAVFFQLWPVKGFQYLLPIAPAFAILAGRLIGRFSMPDIDLFSERTVDHMRWAATALVVVSLAIPAWQQIQPSASGTFLAGTGGVPRGREAGEWVRANVPEGATLLTIGPSMANILQFYGHRRAYGLAVSTNPLHRNPAYDPVPNPDASLRRGDIHYVVWDTYSASRSATFSASVLRYACRYNGKLVHTETVTAEGSDEPKPVIKIYEVYYVSGNEEGVLGAKEGDACA